MTLIIAVPIWLLIGLGGALIFRYTVDNGPMAIGSWIVYIIAGPFTVLVWFAFWFFNASFWSFLGKKI